jgi:hypothetical protein
MKRPAYVNFRERVDYDTAHLDLQNFQTISKLYGIPVYKMTKISCKVQENFLR